MTPYALTPFQKTDDEVFKCSSGRKYEKEDGFNENSKIPYTPSKEGQMDKLFENYNNCNWLKQLQSTRICTYT